MRTYLPSFPFFHPIYSFVFVSPYSPLSLPLPSSVSLLDDSSFCFPSICLFLIFSYSGFNSFCPCSQLFFSPSLSPTFSSSLYPSFSLLLLSLEHFSFKLFSSSSCSLYHCFFFCCVFSLQHLLLNFFLPPSFSLSFPLFFTISPFFRHMASPLPLSPPPHPSFPLPSPLRLPFPPLAVSSSSSPSSSSAS